MAKIRRIIGLGTVFQVENETVGIGTTGSSNTVEVTGNVKSSNANVIGIATLPTYKGFLDKQTRLSNNEVDLDNLVGYVDGQPYYGDFHVHNRSDGTVVNMVGSAHTTLSHQVINDAANLKVDTLSGDIVIDGEFTVSSGTTYCTSVDQLISTLGFAAPTGTTEDRIHCHTAGSMRFNEDFGTLEFYTGEQWRTVNSYKDTGSRGRCVYGGGQPGLSGVGVIDDYHYINIASQGNAISFGELFQPNGAANWAGSSSETRGIFYGGSNPNNNYMNSMEYITIASIGNGLDFGDMTQRTSYVGAVASSTRGIRIGGFLGTPASGPTTNAMDYVEISTLGNSLDFADLTEPRYVVSGCASATRGIAGGGAGDNPYQPSRTIDAFSIATKGDALNFGDLTTTRWGAASSSNSTRAVIAAGRGDVPASVSITSVDTVTIASDGDAIDYADLSIPRDRFTSSASQTRSVFIGGQNNPAGSVTNSIEFILISSGGSAQDFGDAHVDTQYAWGSCSDCHGGLGGF